MYIYRHSCLLLTPGIYFSQSKASGLISCNLNLRIPIDKWKTAVIQLKDSFEFGNKYLLNNSKIYTVI